MHEALCRSFGTTLDILHARDGPPITQRTSGLVVISSCSHCGVINAIKTAISVSGVDKLHAVLGGFHLGVVPPDYVEHTIAELKAMRPDVVIPMHCTGRAFIAKMREEMPAQLVDWNTGSRFTFGV
jgi:7,8-dihydropterin-6-yl-methyl-4-(beta-D-ribofuranosyl)aminobenzene 5'-phosphate synthase